MARTSHGQTSKNHTRQSLHRCSLLPRTLLAEICFEPKQILYSGDYLPKKGNVKQPCSVVLLLLTEKILKCLHGKQHPSSYSKCLELLSSYQSPNSSTT